MKLLIGNGYDIARRTVTKYRELLKIPQSRLRKEALGKMGEDAVPALIQELESPDQDVRILATKSLGRIGKDAYDAISLLIEGLQDSSSGVRWQSSLALRKIGENAVPALIEELQNPNLEVCHSAARILGQIGSDAEIAVPILIQLVQNEDESARRLANTCWHA